MTTPKALLPAVLALTFLLPATAAQAATKKVQDGPDGYRLPAAENLTRATYTNNTQGFTARLHVKDLDKSRTQSVGFNLHIGPKRTALDVFVTRFKNGKLRNSVGISPDKGGPTDPSSCPALKASWRADHNRIEIFVPWSCMADVRQTIKVDAFFSMGDGTHGDPSDFVRAVKVRYS